MRTTVPGTAIGVLAPHLDLHYYAGTLAGIQQVLDTTYELNTRARRPCGRGAGGLCSGQALRRC